MDNHYLIAKPGSPFTHLWDEDMQDLLDSLDFAQEHCEPKEEEG